MPQSKKNKDRKEKLNQFKQKTKKRNNMSLENAQIPETRSVPVWKSGQPIEMNGLEFEAIFNFINSVQGAYGAVQSIMNKNILNGNVTMAFEKLNESKTDYIPMTDEEQAPHQKEFAERLSEIKNQVENPQPTPDEQDTQEGLPQLDGIVDQNGNPLSST